jgi:hypothetical protein
MPCPRTGRVEQGQKNNEIPAKKFASPSEGAAEEGGLGEEFRRARAESPAALLC